MNDGDLRRALLSLSPPDELAAQRRAWRVVRAAFEEREPVRWPTRHARPLLALAAGLVLVAAAVTPPGQAVLESVRDAVRSESKPILFSLPASGRLLVNSASGPWIVQSDGSKRLLGAHENASWSPHGLFVVATRGRELYTLDPKGEVRWSLARPGQIAGPRWSPSGYRIAYLSGRSLRVVAGDGTGDRLLARAPATAAPAWKPDPRHVLAFADQRGRVNVVDTDENVLLWRSRPGKPPGLLAWSSDGSRLVSAEPSEIRVFDGRGRLLRRISAQPGVIANVAFAPREHTFAVIRHTDATTRTEVDLLEAEVRARPPRRIFSSTGDFSDLAWSPNGHWLLLGWTSADQWLFIRPAGPRTIKPVADVSAQFNPDMNRAAGFPTVAGWCCS